MKEKFFQKYLIDVWESKKYVDLWSVNHTLSGAILAGISIFLNLPFWPSFIISLIIMVGWELIEVYFNIEETVQNRIMDVVTDLIGYFIMYYLMLNNIFDNVMLFVFVAVIFIILEIWGWAAYKMR